MEQLSLFNNGNNYIEKITAKVLSASRMTDMPKFYRKELIEGVKNRLDKSQDIHTLVLWSKHPDSLLESELYAFLLEIKKKGVQLFYQCTITGMGKRIIGTNKDGSEFILEPGVPKPHKAIKDLEKVIELVGDAKRIKLRIDPIVKLRNKCTDEVFSSLPMIEEIIKETSRLGIKNYTFSFLENGIHNKVDYRFQQYEWEIITPNLEQKQNVYKWLIDKGQKYNVIIEPCCVEGLDSSRCINGYLLTDLHKENKRTILKEPKKRSLCNCTDSIDIGGWPPKKCYSGCKYCYANAYL